jgi:hypothetical protein
MEVKYFEMTVQRGEKTFKFLVPEGSSIGETYDAAFDVLQYMVNMAKEAAEKARPVHLNEEPAPAPATADQAAN